MTLFARCSLHYLPARKATELAERYRRMPLTAWFIKAHRGKSLGLVPAAIAYMRRALRRKEER